MTAAQRKAIRDRAWRDMTVTYTEALPAKPVLLEPGLRDAAKAEADFRRRARENGIRTVPPLVGHGADEIAWARFYDIDWRLVHAIEWMESRFGTDPPARSELFHNAWGLGPWRRFRSWDEGYFAIYRALRRQYIGKGLRTLSAIAAKYAPSFENNTGLWIVTVSGVYHQLGGHRYPVR